MAMIISADKATAYTIESQPTEKTLINNNENPKQRAPSTNGNSMMLECFAFASNTSPNGTPMLLIR